MIDLTLLAHPWTEEGARAIFAILVCQCVKSQYPDAVEIEPNPGDEGIDTCTGNLTGTCRIWQSKYFIDTIGKSQQAQIRDSFKTASESQKINNIKKWTLCIPGQMDVDAKKWWEGWKKRAEKQSGIKIELWDKNDFIKFYCNPELTNIFEIALRKRVASIDEFKNLFKKIEIEHLPNEDKYENAIFVKQLEIANIVIHRSARTAFYNFELLKKAIEESSDEDEKKKLRTLMETIYSMWEKKYLTRTKDNFGKEFYLDFVKELSENKALILDEIMRLHDLHNEGVIHGWSDICLAGWIEDFKNIFQEKKGNNDTN